MREWELLVMAARVGDNVPAAERDALRRICKQRLGRLSQGQRVKLWEKWRKKV